MRVVALSFLLVAVALAGCAGGDETSDAGVPATNADGSPIEAMQMYQVRPGGDADAATRSTTFSGQFDFDDNRQYHGQAAATLGQPWTHMQEHDLEPFLPIGTPWMAILTIDAPTGSGDIDLFFGETDALATWWCDCSFGGYNQLTVYGIGNGAAATVIVQYDEIHGDPTDADLPLTGFSYEVDVQITADPAMLPPGVPIAIPLREAGDHVVFENHTQAISVFGPDDTRLPALTPASGVYTLEEGAPAGEYVFIQQLNGMPMGARTGSATADAALPIRFLDIDGVFETAIIPQGQAGSVAFDVPTSAIDIGGCGITDIIEVDPAFQMLDPSGEVWSSFSSSGVSVLGWGVCESSWPGDPDLLPGEWTVEFTDTFGVDRELWNFYSFYVR